MNDFQKLTEIKDFLDEKYKKYNNSNFIINDPISIPHKFTKKGDIEISGFLVATIAWGQRKSIIKNANRIIENMDNSPHEFIINFKKNDLKKFDNICHRTFNSTDLKFFLLSLQNIYNNLGGLESIFNNSNTVYEGLVNLHSTFFSINHLSRTKKHLANISKGSAGKRLNMFLRWMVRKDKNGVDFGIWKKINASELYIPLDVHSGRIGRDLGLLKRQQNDWKSVVELTDSLKQFDPHDPIKYDFALFGTGVNEDF